MWCGSDITGVWQSMRVCAKEQLSVWKPWLWTRRTAESHHELVEEVQVCRWLPSVSVKAAHFERTLSDEQDKAAGQETQQGEWHIDEQLQDERGEGQAAPEQLKHYCCHHAQAKSGDEVDGGVDRSRRGGGFKHGPVFLFGTAAPSSQWCSGSWRGEHAATPASIYESLLVRLQSCSFGPPARPQRSVYSVHSCIPSTTTLSPRSGIPALTSPPRLTALCFPRS